MVRRTLEKSQKAKQKLGRCSRRTSNSAQSNKNGEFLTTQAKKALTSKILFQACCVYFLSSFLSLSVSVCAFCCSLAKRRSLSQWEIELVSRLQTPTISYLARSRSAVCLSRDTGTSIRQQNNKKLYFE